MTYFHFVMKRHLTVILVVAALLLWAATSTVFALSIKSETVIIGIDANGTRVITNQEDPLFKTEVVNFVRRFFGLLYNFDAETFDANVGLATDLMSADLWAKEKEKILKLSEIVKSEKVSHSSTVQSISKKSDGTFQIAIRTSEMRRLKNQDQEVIVTVALRPVARTKSNPWGMELTKLEEEKL